MNAASTGTEELIAEREGALGIIRLNRPKALNALTMDMIKAIDAALDRFENDPAIGVVLLEGAGERGLCAGGDIRALHESGRNRDGKGLNFLGTEYRLNARIEAFPKPYVAFMDGLVMGGGVGLSSHGKHRIVTERTRLAMPETGIGFLTDVGGTWLLSQTPGETGTYLALTGEMIGAGDAIYTGLADVMVPSGDLPGLRAQLARIAAEGAADSVADVLKSFSAVPQTGPVEAHRSLIDATMHHDTVEEIVAALERETSDFAKVAAHHLAAKSPTSLKITLRLLRLGRASSRLEDCLVREYRVAGHLLEGHDFYEGVRAAVIDKDRNPRWSPATLEGVTAEQADALLVPRGEDELSFQ